MFYSNVKLRRLVNIFVHNIYVYICQDIHHVLLDLNKEIDNPKLS
jgi:hypothetical protein